MYNVPKVIEEYATLCLLAAPITMRMTMNSWKTHRRDAICYLPRDHLRLERNEKLIPIGKAGNISSTFFKPNSLSLPGISKKSYNI